MENLTQQMTVRELAKAIMPLLESKGYSKVYIKSIRYTFNQLNKFCDSKNESRFSAELGQRFIMEHYNVTPDTNPRNIAKANRVTDMLLSYQQFGAVLPRRQKHHIFPARFIQQLNAYYDDMRRNFANEKTIKRHKIALHRLTSFLDGQNIRSVSDVTRESLNDYVKKILCNLDIAYLNQFDRFCIERNISIPILTKELFDAWCEKRPDEKVSSHYVRVKRIRGFAVFCHDSLARASVEIL